MREPRAWMAQALALGARADGTTSPNPRVGCIVVRDGEAVGTGYHRVPGGPHAEAEALAEAGVLARGATVYVSLEPCAHHGRTPPCTDLLIAAGVGRVVAAVQDPNPLVDGRGIEALRASGIEVELGLLSVEAEALNDAFFFHHRHGRPLVTLKAAVTLDGQLAAAGGNSRWITGDVARRFAHRLRLRHDAVLVGAGTLRADDPRLDVRLPGPVAPRIRAVISRSLDIDAGCRLLREGGPGPRPRIYTSANAPPSRADALAKYADIVELPDCDEGLDLAALLADLSAAGVQSVLVEGGARTHAAFLRRGLADRGALFLAPLLFGARGGTPLVDGPAVAEPSLGWRLERRTHVPLGEDLLILGRLAAPGPESACSRD